MDNLSRSSVIRVVIPLMVNFMKLEKNVPFDEEDKILNELSADED